MFRKKFELTAVLTIVAAVAGAAHAQDAYPAGPVTIMVPAAAGGPSDTVARLVAQSMSKTLGQQVLVENMGGAGGSLGAGNVAKADPDGYRLLLYHIGVATFAALYPNLPYKPIEDFSSVGLITEVPMTIVGRKDLEPKTFTDLMAYVKENGPAVTFGTAGTGAVSDLCGRLLQDALGTKITLVPYKGMGPAMTDLMGGRIDLACDQTTNTTTQIKAQEVHAYAVTTKARIAVLPDLPTIDESGLKGFELSAWHALWAPKDTPLPIREKLSEALKIALKDQTVVDRFASLGTVPVSQDLASPAALDEKFRAEVDRLTKVITTGGK
ncbi:tripartite tricarboxylate transporter substrate binding protein BugD [Agrobacterium vitis]|uniref:Tripartite tricarboxylate transporter substrate binding protein BugD n=1 Tax=Agrobacterium vitis TaxID=373 RepID=A0AAE5AZ27_AGRVI|nr:tripartite tricarboxylate transporter substrate binding protein BugD [Agrobacterium vitis]MCF1501811.1 tripartite tricarboxylate transporter substrate binding protein BugD [Allorhizobium sp. Av2]MCM2443313.1 tripartite tricarboxylate transporter substrate binding protein BugD [Agrobacterium vitis]MUZ60925.1 tripartite tricarboxylate transporter substrate binding protein BugD [Agrobacterium vitis]MVA69217.1 tripartite tricarboxylate transporter substrate binding protein BugD [Agrobacterium vi